MMMRRSILAGAGTLILIIAVVLIVKANITDTDSDGLDDNWEIQHFGDLSQSATGDPDNDDLDNLAEYNNNTDPNNPDTDSDGLNDYDEVSQAYNPTTYTRIIYVDASRTDDHGDGLTLDKAKKTISAGIKASQSSSIENVVLVAAGTYTGDANRNLNFNGYDIKVSSLDGAETTIIDLENSARAFDIHSGESIASWIDGFTIRNGAASDGGAVVIQNAALQIKNCRFENNTATSCNGAVSVNSALTKISNCSFTGNISYWAGAISLYQSPGSTIDNCDFINNSAHQAGVIAVDCNDGLIEISKCRFLNNHAEADCGALYVNADNPMTLNITNCLFSGNKAKRCPDIQTNSNTIYLNLQNITIAKSEYTGTISCRFNSGTVTTITNSIIQGNILNLGLLTANNNCTQTDLSSFGTGNITVDPLLTAEGNLKSGSPCINTGTATEAPEEDLYRTPRPVGAGVDMGCHEFNDSDNDGLPDDYEIFYGLDAGNSSDAELDADGDGLSNLEEYNYGTSPTMQDTDNDGVDDKIELDNGTNPRLPLMIVYVDNSAFDDSADGLTPATAKQTISAAIAASRLAYYDNEIIVAAGTYTGSLNRNLSLDGFDMRISSADGAETTIIDLQDSGRFFEIEDNLRLDGFTICNGWYDDNDGGAIYAENSLLVIRNCIFNYNASSDYGGAIASSYGKLQILDSVFTGNNAYGCGAITIWNDNEVEIDNCDFDANIATGYKVGAVGIDIKRGVFNVSKCKFTNNQAGGDCGALYMITNNGGPGVLTVTNCLFSGNTDSGGNGDIYTDGDTDVKIVNSTLIKGNTSTTACRFNSASIVVLQNNIVFGSIICEGMLIANNNSYHNDLSSYGSGNIITSDPLLDFVGKPAENSPCIDAARTVGAPAEDLEGNSRPQGNSADIGCYESKVAIVDIDDAGEDENAGTQHSENLNQTDSSDYNNNGISSLNEFTHNIYPTVLDTVTYVMNNDWETLNFNTLNPIASTAIDDLSDKMEYQSNMNQKQRTGVGISN